MTDLYRPTHNEIVTALNDPFERWPNLRTRIERAAGILQDFDIRYRSGIGWQIGSQSDVTKWYDVDAQGCTCFDYVNRHAVAEGRAFCKHLIAFLTYREILTKRMIAMVAGTMTNAAAKRLKTDGTILIQDHDMLRGAKLNGMVPDFRYAYDHRRNRRSFADVHEMAKFARWLALADVEIKRAEHARESLAIDRMAARMGFDDVPPVHPIVVSSPGEADHVFHTWDDLDHYMRTGEIPILRTN